MLYRNNKVRKISLITDWLFGNLLYRNNKARKISLITDWLFGNLLYRNNKARKISLITDWLFGRKILTLYHVGIIAHNKISPLSPTRVHFPLMIFSSTLAQRKPTL